jgi:hypothetical protein
MQFKLISCLSTLLILIPAVYGNPECVEMVIPITITKANNIGVPAGGLSVFTLNNLLSGLVNTLFTRIIPVQGTFQITGRYCEPEVFNSTRQNTLQLLAHPATYDRNYVITVFLVVG